MDATESDRDVIIQRHSSDFIADFDRSLRPFLRKPNGNLRRRVRTREAVRLGSHVLEPFQELPQLLDPHLPKWLPVLAEAYLESLQDRGRTKLLSTRSQLLAPLPNAICLLIYTLAKIRGEKIIVRFLNVEAKYLERLLLVLEDSERQKEAGEARSQNTLFVWHERYVALLWLSQLFFAPFDLSTISSGDADDLDRPVIEGFRWPANVPGIATRVIPLATKYLGSPGKERDGAKALLVRLSMRKDMQALGILESLVRWCLFVLRPGPEIEAKSIYTYIGCLAFLSGVLRASDNTSIMDPYLSDVFDVLQEVATEDTAASQTMNGSASARKLMIKIVRSITTLVLRKHRQSMADTEIVETSIGYMLERLADNDTPVRLASSKGLSIITFKLPPDMASQVIEAVLDSLNRNVLWMKNRADPSAPPTRDLTAVDPLEWHGLMLTLSHLLYRRSPPPENLSDIIHALLVGLAFEKRSPSGGSIGANVRDASCFGIWALARRYSTAELLRVETKSVMVAQGHEPGASILQIIATELVVTASLDPAGNIRRGASAALQELIGRHPDTVDQGIPVVQAVDYHAVALRSRAIHEVALQATRLSGHYGRALLHATLGWRGIGDMDAGARRVAAASFGHLTAEISKTADAASYAQRFNQSVDTLLTQVRSLQTRQVEERHGLLLSLAAVFDLAPALMETERDSEQPEQISATSLCDSISEILLDAKNTKYRKPELVAEAVGHLVTSSMPLLMRQAGIFKVSCGQDAIKNESVASASTCKGLIDSLEERPRKLEELLGLLNDNMMLWLDRNEAEAIWTSSEAASVLVLLSTPDRRAHIIETWCEKVRRPSTQRNRHGNGFYHALTRAYSIMGRGSEATADDKESSGVLSEALAERWVSDVDIDTRVAILQSLIGKAILKDKTTDFLSLIRDGLDNYTTTARGDVGSHVRLEAIRATKTIWGCGGYSKDVMSMLYPRILRLAGEKLDRVRIEAQATLSMALDTESAATLMGLSFTSKEYFQYLFGLCDERRLHPSCTDGTGGVSKAECTSFLLAGLSTSADTGNEDLVIASRAALAAFCEGGEETGEAQERLSRVCTGLVDNLKQHQGQDRVLVPTLELVAFLFSAGLLQKDFLLTSTPAPLDLRQLSLLAQKAAYKTGNVRKIEACIKVYGGIAAAAEDDDDGGDDMTSELALKRKAGTDEARKRLGALMMHPWPRVRTLVVDELWTLTTTDSGGGDNTTPARQSSASAALMSVDWSKADKAHVQRAIRDLGLEQQTKTTTTPAA